MSSSAGHSKNPSIGIKLVYKPPAGVQTDVDIVAVHGLGGDVYDTWTWKPKSKKSDDDTIYGAWGKQKEPPKEPVFWLRDLLPAEVPSARILSYGYNSDPAKWMEAASTNNVHQHAQTLVTELHYFRRRANERYRPIIFVCHSLGGIVVKQALISSNNNSINHNEDLRSIKVSTYGVLFLGTPHMGSDLAQWGKWIESAVRIVAPRTILDSNKSLVSTLDKSSEILSVITDGFLPIAPDLSLFFFWEEFPTQFKGRSEVIVQYHSAVPESLPNAGKASIHATHSDMCKFENEEAPGWNVLAGVLCDWVMKAPDRIMMAWEQEHQRKHLGAQWKVRGTIQSSQRRSPSPGSIDTGFYTGPEYPRALEGRQPAMIGTVHHPYEVSEPEDEWESVRGYQAPQTVVTPHMFKPPTLQENKYFTARTTEIARIHSVMLKSRAILIGSATGTGKTHLARQYFFEHRNNFQAGVFWIECKSLKRGTFSMDVLDLQFAAIAEELQLPLMILEDDQYPPDANEVIRRQVLTWFENNQGWLVVLDGVDVTSNDQINDISKYVPTVTQGSVIITTVNESLAGAARLGSPELLRLERIPVQEAIPMLFHYAQIDHPTDRDREVAVELLQELSLIPLMIHSAGSYIKSKKMPVGEYLKKYKKRPFVDQGILDVEPFHVIFGQIEEKYVEANKLLRILCFYEQQVPTDMLLWGIKNLPLPIQRQFLAKEDGRLDFNNTIGQLLAVSLIERTPGFEESPDLQQSASEKITVDTLRLHSVAQDVCISRMRRQSKTVLRESLKMAIDIFCNSYDTLERRRGDAEFLVSDYKRYVVHGNELYEHAKKYKVDIERLGGVLGKVKELANGDGQIAGTGDRRSMFVRSSSLTDSGPETPTPTSSRVPSWNIPPQSPTANRKDIMEGSSESSSSMENTKKWVNNLERLNNEKPFEFRYTPPKGPRNPRGRAKGRASWGPSRASTSIEYRRHPAPTSHVYTEEIDRVEYSSPRPLDAASVVSEDPNSPSGRLRGLLRGARGFRSSTGLHPGAPEFVPGQFTPRGRSPPGQHFNPLGRASTPVTGQNVHQHQQQRPSFPTRNRSGSLPPHLQHQVAHSAPGGLSMMRNPPYGSSPTLSQYSDQFSVGGSPIIHQAPMMSPSVSASSHMTYTPMPPYPVSPGPGIQLDPFVVQQPNPFSRNFVSSRDISNSAVARSILGPRDRPPSESCSEPILEDDDFYQPSTGAPGMLRDFSSNSVQQRRSPRSSSNSRSPSPYAPIFTMDSSNMNSPYPPPRVGSRPLSSNSGGHGPHRPMQNSPYAPPPPVTSPPPAFITSPPLQPFPENPNSPGLGIEGVVYAFQQSPPSRPAELAGHTRHASLGDGPLNKSATSLGLPKGSPLRRSSIPDELPASGLGDGMVRSRSEPGQGQGGGRKNEKSPPMPGSWGLEDGGVELDID